MSKKKIEELSQREERIKAELKKVKAQKRREATKESQQRRKRLNHARFMIAGRVLEKARGDATNPIWKWLDETVANPETRAYDRQCLEDLKDEYYAP